VTIATITIDDEEGALAAGARSQLYQTLAAAFSYPSAPSAESSDGVGSSEWWRRLLALSPHLPFELPTPPHGTTRATPIEVLQQAYVSTFEVGVGRPYCPLYEGSHRSGRMKLMEELVRFYEHFGLITQPGDHPDHLSAELEFMHYLAFKEAAALAHGELVADMRRAQRDFLDRHLCRWLPAVRKRLQSADDIPAFYPTVAVLAEESCKRDLAWLKGQ
jgi:DMSO reductase family type II enzyme chaperone